MAPAEAYAGRHEWLPHLIFREIWDHSPLDLEGLITLPPAAVIEFIPS